MVYVYDYPAVPDLIWCHPPWPQEYTWQYAVSNFTFRRTELPITRVSFSQHMSECGELVWNLKGWVVNLTLWTGATSPSETHPASFGSWLFISCWGTARRNCNWLVHASYWEMIDSSFNNLYRENRCKLWCDDQCVCFLFVAKGTVIENTKILS